MATRDMRAVLRRTHFGANAAAARRERVELGLEAPPRPSAQQRREARDAQIAHCNGHVDDLLAGHIDRHEIPTEMIAGSSRALVLPDDGVALLGAYAHRQLDGDLRRRGLVVFRGAEMERFEHVNEEAVDAVLLIKRFFRATVAKVAAK